MAKIAAKRALSKVVKKAEPVYSRIVLKLSGESFQGPQGFGIHGETIQAIANLGENIAVRRFVRFKVGEVSGAAGSTVESVTA